MSTKTRGEVLARLRRQHAKARGFDKPTIIDQAVRLLGSHRKAAIRALQKPRADKVPRKPVATRRGRPRQ